MEVTFNEIRAREIVNIFDGKRLGRAVDIVFEKDNGTVQGLIVPGLSKFLRKADDIFVPISRIKKIGEDVILVYLPTGQIDEQPKCNNKKIEKNQMEQQNGYVRYHRTSIKIK